MMSLLRVSWVSVALLLAVTATAVSASKPFVPRPMPHPRGHHHVASAVSLVTAPNFDLLLPAAGQVVVAGSQMIIAFGGGLPEWNVSLALGDVDRWQIVAEITAVPISASSGQYIWTLPSTFNASSNFLIYIENTPNTTSWRYGPNFKISNSNAFALTMPVEGAVFAPESTIAIQWSGGLNIWDVLIQFANVTGRVELFDIATVPNSLSMLTYQLPSSLDCTSDYQITVQDTNNIQWVYGPIFNVACP